MISRYKLRLVRENIEGEERDVTERFIIRDPLEDIIRGPSDGSECSGPRVTGIIIVVSWHNPASPLLPCQFLDLDLMLDAGIIIG